MFALTTLGLWPLRRGTFYRHTTPLYARLQVRRSAFCTVISGSERETERETDAGSDEKSLRCGCIVGSIGAEEREPIIGDFTNE